MTLQTALASASWAKLGGTGGRLYVCGEHRETLSIGPSGEEIAPLEIVSCITENGATADNPGILNQTELLVPKALTRISEGIYAAESTIHGSGRILINN